MTKLDGTMNFMFFKILKTNILRTDRHERVQLQIISIMTFVLSSAKTLFIAELSVILDQLFSHFCDRIYG